MVLRGSPMTLGKLPGIFFTFVFRPGPMLVKRKHPILVPNFVS